MEDFFINILNSRIGSFSQLEKNGFDVKNYIHERYDHHIKILKKDKPLISAKNEFALYLAMNDARRMDNKK